MLLEEMKIPSVYEKCDFKNLEISEETKSLAFDFMFGNEWCFFIRGDCGSGKSHLAVSMLKEFYKTKDEQGLYLTVSDISSQFREAEITKKDFYHFLWKINLKRVVVLDDISINVGESWKIELIYEIIMHRYLNKLKTIITSTSSLGKLEDIYGLKLIKKILEKSILITTMFKCEKINKTH